MRMQQNIDRKQNYAHNTRPYPTHNQVKEAEEELIKQNYQKLQHDLYICNVREANNIVKCLKLNRGMQE